MDLAGYTPVMVGREADYSANSHHPLCVKGAVMRFVIAGGTGFVGSPLAEVYAEEGHDVRVLTRSIPDGDARHDPGTGMPGITRVGWKGDGTAGAWTRHVDGAD